MTFLKWPLALTFLVLACTPPPFARAAETAAPSAPEDDTNLIHNGSFSQWRQAGDAVQGSGFDQQAPVAWSSRKHALTLHKGKGGTQSSDYTYRPDQTPGGVQPINPASKSLIVQVKTPDFAYRIFQDFAIEPGNYVFSGALGVAGRTSGFPTAGDHLGRAIPWKITLELMDGTGRRMLLTTLNTALPKGSDSIPDAAKFKPLVVVVPEGVVKASFSIWCFGGNAYGHVDDLKLTKVTMGPNPAVPKTSQ